MRVVRTIPELRAAVKAARDEGVRVGFVPTMGFLHEGHAALIRHSKQRCGFTVVSIFVNPTQFGPTEDFASYPRDLEADQGLCLRMGVDLLFIPEASEIYPTGFSTFVEPGPLGDLLCGHFRPGHFRGVATVVAKLFNLVLPDLAFFGQKDLQQTAVLRRMVKDLGMPVELAVVRTIREPDGLAMSSRNTYLDAQQRTRALCIHRGLSAAEDAFCRGTRETQALLACALDHLLDVDDLQYCELVDLQTLEPRTGTLERPAALAVAAYVGRTRLIDNVILATPDQAAALGIL